MHHFASIDLSSNKLTGTLVDSYQHPSSSVNMAVNRLSGNVPSSLRNVNATTSVNIIEGNLFECPLLRNDVSSEETACGSSNLEHPFIAWLVLTAVTLVVMVVVRYSREDIIIRIRHYTFEWWETSCRCLSPIAGTSDAAIMDGLYHTKCAMRYLTCACSMSIILTSFFVLIVMMSFIATKLHGTSHINSLYQIQYLYTTTAAYFVGATSTVLLSLYVTVAGIVVVILCTIARPKLNISRASRSESARRIDPDDDDAKDTQDYRDALSALAIRLAVGIAVTAVALAINFGFVRIVYFGKTPNLTAVNLAFAVIKALYSSTMVPFSSRLVPKASRQVHIVMMTIVVNIVCPGLATLLSSPLCLLYKLRPTSISASYDYIEFMCDAFVCDVRPVRSSSTITPQWFYSYQCSSSFLTSYLPNFVYLYIINGIISPSFDILAMLLSSTGLAAKCKAYIQSVFKSSDVFFSMYDKVAVGRVFLVAANSSSVSKPSDDVEMYAIDHRDDKKDANRITAVINTTDSHDHYDINVTRLVPNLCVDITLLLTFGLASPLLAVVISYSIIINTLLWYLALGRYITIVSKARSSSACYDHLERAFVDTWRCLPEAWWIMSIFIGLFWSLFVNDMIGDKNHTTGIVLAVMMMVWCPLVFISAHRMLAVNTDVDTTSTSSSGSIGDYVYSMSSSVHTIIWKHVFHFSSSSSSSPTSTSDDNSSFSSNRVSTISETVSPLGSLNNTKRVGF